MNTRDRLSFKHIFTRLPWLRILLVVVIGVAMTLDLSNLTISKVDNNSNPLRVAPMSRHVRVRDLDGKKLIALTFDDGPSEATTPELLDLLHEKSATATFFMLGSRARSYPDIVKRAEKEGHLVASHTMYHQNFASISAGAIKDDIAEAKATFDDILDHYPALARPPYGNTNNTVKDNIDAPIILWSVDTLDWKNKDVAAIDEVAHEQIHDGAIVLMHDIYQTSVEAVDQLIDEFRDEGYEFVTVTELAKLRGVTLRDGVVYYNFRP